MLQFGSIRVGPPAQVTMRAQKSESRREVALRYAAAYGCTLIAVAASQLYLSNVFALSLAAITLAGLPLSLGLRAWESRPGRQLPRFAINSFIVLMSLSISGAIIWNAMRESGMSGFDSLDNLFLAYSPRQTFALLMQTILVLAACRCVAILTDVDAMLCVLPSFSVLLLLIVVQAGDPAVVAYFLAWIVCAAVLFSLDHRAESRQGLSGFVPALVPGQDVTLSARGLASVMGFSLVCAGLVSYTLSVREVDERGAGETAMANLAARLTRYALNLPEVSANAGPERQIDFSSGPALVTRAPLWDVYANNRRNDQPLQPLYWRLFTLARYNGATWSQTIGTGREVNPHTIAPSAHIMAPFVPPLQDQRGLGPWPPSDWRQPNTGPNDADWLEQRDRERRERERRERDRRDGVEGRIRGRRDSGGPWRFGDGEQRRGFGFGFGRGFGRSFRRPFLGYDLSRLSRARNYGHHLVPVVQSIKARSANVGFLPMLPGAQVANFVTDDAPPRSTPMRLRSDGALEMSVLQPEQLVRVLSLTPSDATYGLSLTVPPRHRGARPNPDAHLSREERKTYLSLPPLPRRVRELAWKVVSGKRAEESDYIGALRLSREVMVRATYTLRPPPVPKGRDATDFFLFDTRRGYCTHFAGALTVLCRAAGIPARVVSGFAPPLERLNGSGMTLLESDAHAWTEVWVDGWGWATLDATPPDDRGNNAPGWWDNWLDLLGAHMEATTRWTRENASTLAQSGLAALALTSSWLLWLLFRRAARYGAMRRGEMGEAAVRQEIERLYDKAARRLTRRFRRKAPWETPGEWLQAARREFAAWDFAPFDRLTEFYVRARYSPLPVAPHEALEARQALKEWKGR